MSQQQIEQPEKITEFWGPYRFLSNFWPAQFVWEGIVWSDSEHAYVAAKLPYYDPPRIQDEAEQRSEMLKISKITKAGDVKRYGSGKMIPEWHTDKVALMEEIVRAKFKQNPHLAQQLIDTGDAILEEGNRWNDTEWGVCPPGSGNGKNYLGKILMLVREELKGK